MQPETWLHEAGIASNRISPRYGEFFLIRVHTARQAPRAGSSGIYLDNFLCYSFFLFFGRWVSFFLAIFFWRLSKAIFLVDFIGKDTRVGNGC